MSKLVKHMKTTIQCININKVSLGTWVRTVMLMISAVIYVAETVGIKIPVVDENKVANTLMVLFGIISFLQCYWKNNSFTDAAQEED